MTETNKQHLASKRSAEEEKKILDLFVDFVEKKNELNILNIHLEISSDPIEKKELREKIRGSEHELFLIKQNIENLNLTAVEEKKFKLKALVIDENKIIAKEEKAPYYAKRVLAELEHEKIVKKRGY